MIVLWKILESQNLAGKGYHNFNGLQLLFIALNPLASLGSLRTPGAQGSLGLAGPGILGLVQGDLELRSIDCEVSVDTRPFRSTMGMLFSVFFEGGRFLDLCTGYKACTIHVCWLPGSRDIFHHICLSFVY